MDDTAKYLIHAAITTDGVVERSDVVGAIFGQTEGLLGEELDLRDLQQSSKVGRIDVQIESENGQSFGSVTIASSLDKVKTAILAASLETITRVGPCQSDVRVTDIEDVREAKRREVVDRAKELLSTSFDDSVMTSTEILDEVKESVRVEDITEFEGLPAGPRVLDSDAIVVVEGRADVLTLLRYGVKNAVGVEGTNVPEAVAELTYDRTVTAFLDGDRGGELILRELSQVGDVDYVAFAPDGQSVEDLQRHEVMSALRNKVAFEMLPAEGDVREAATDGPVSEGDAADPPRESQTTESAAPTSETGSEDASADGQAGVTVERLDEETPGESTSADAPSASDAQPTSRDAASANGATSVVAEASESDADADVESEAETAVTAAESDAATNGTAEETASEATSADAAESDSRPQSLREHVREVVEAGSGTVRFLDEDLATVDEHDAADAFDAIRDASTTPHTVVLDGVFDQRLADVSAQRGVEHAVAAATGEFVKKPVSVRVLTAEQLLDGGE
ncbi:DNA primase DnaG [Halogeometricum sp. S1BR25-6]|uniref:DNA primase DnaG n=1 Tax=Halogeometricum salsisoli TaxID=2950536 RepID=A0ABU2GHF7_9EURY|nr:DNA primase DnaG [Halogeometricum sp. S1BR25-6]MDS0299713.1 DNA primase DnaG [Halogeometricum sp. S1BR25-6]